jgi:hypothetical protein
MQLVNSVMMDESPEVKRKVFAGIVTPAKDGIYCVVEEAFAEMVKESFAR